MPHEPWNWETPEKSFGVACHVLADVCHVFANRILKCFISTEQQEPEIGQLSVWEGLSRSYAVVSLLITFNHCCCVTAVTRAALAPIPCTVWTRFASTNIVKRRSGTSIVKRPNVV